MKHWLSPYGTWFRKVDVVVDWVGARSTDLTAVMTYAEVDELAAEAGERMTYGGVIARYDDVVPHNIYTEIAGKRVSYPLG